MMISELAFSSSTTVSIGMDCLDFQAGPADLAAAACVALSRYPQHKEDIVLVTAILAARQGIVDSCMSTIAGHLDRMQAYK